MTAPSSTTSASPGDGRPRGVVPVVAAALFGVIGASTSFGIALPVLAGDIGAGQTELTLIETAYTVVFAAVLLPVGLAADRFGRRRVLVGGLLVFGAAQSLIGLAGTPWLIAALRAVSALGAAAVFPSTLAVLVEAYPEQLRARAVAIWVGVSSVSATLGGLISGVLVDTVSWRAVPGLFGVLGLLVAIPVARTTRDHPRPELALDWPGAVLALVGLAGVVLGIAQAGQSGPTAPAALVPIVLGAAALVGFVVRELRARTPMLPLRLLRDRGAVVGSLLLLLVFAAFSAFTFLGPQYLQYVRGYSSLTAAVALLPADVGLVLAIPTLTFVLRRFGARGTGALGAGLTAAGLLGLALGASSASYWPTALALVVFGAGTTLAVTPATTLVVAGLPASRLTVASAFTYLTRQVGVAASSAAVGAGLLVVYQSRVADALVGLPAPAAERASDGLSEVVGLAPELGAAGDALLAAAQTAFTAGYQVALVGCAAAAALGGLLCALLAPSGLTEALDAPPDLTPTTAPDTPPARTRPDLPGGTS